jgi:PAS domain S-box-containing protein
MAFFIPTLSAMNETTAKKILEFLIENSLEGVFAFDKDFRYTLWSRAMESITGLKSGEVIGKNAFQVFPFLKDIGEDRYFHDALAGKKSSSSDRRYVVPSTNRDGWFEGNYSPLFDARGEIVGGLALIREITEKKIVVDALRKNEERHRAVVESARDAIISSDHKGDIIDWNDEAEKMFGYRASEAIGKSLNIIMPERFREAHSKGMERFNRTGEKRLIGKTIEIVGQRKDGTEFPLELSLSCWEAGGAHYFTGIIRDITERKLAETALRRSNEELEIKIQKRTRSLNITYSLSRILAEQNTLREAVPQILRLICQKLGWTLGIFWSSSDDARYLEYAGEWCEPCSQVGKFIEISKAWNFEKGSGLPGTVWQTQKPLWIKDVINVIPRFPRVDYAAQSGIHGAFAFPITFDKKVLAVAEFFSSEIEEPDYEFLDMMATIGDHIGVFIQRKKTEEDNLKSQVILKEQAGRLAESNKELEQFAYIASHDLQEPLRKIINYGERLAGKLPEMPQSEKEYLERMRSAAFRMKNVIEDLLQYSRISKREGMSVEDLELREILSEVMSDLEIKINETNAKIVLSDGACRFKGNRAQMRHLFQNLITNAIKFRREGVEPRILIDCLAVDDRIKISVKDNGIGFENKYLDRIFQPFQRLHTRDEYEGSGIGLAIVHKIVQNHQGEVSADGKPGEGAVFTIILPRDAGSTVVR